MSTAAVTVERAVESQEWLTADLITLIAEQFVSTSQDVETIASHVNKSYWYGDLPGIPAPKISNEGRVVDAHKTRQYSIAEIAAVLNTDSCKRAIEVLKAERAAQEAEDKLQARVEQLAQARDIKQARGEADLVPLLWNQVQHLTSIVEILLARVDAGLVGANLEDVTVEKLPEWN